MRLGSTVLALGLLAAGAVQAQQPEPLGRLFFTPEQREALDARRRARLPDKPSAVAASPTTRVDGQVTRSSGRSTLWLDGFAIRDGVQPDGMGVRRRGDPGRVTIVVGEDRRTFDVRVGETLDRGTGEVTDPLRGGEIRVRRRGAGGR